MRTISIFLVTMLLQVGIHAQVPVIQWEKSFGGSLRDLGADIKLSSDGGNIMVGSTLSSDIIPMGNHHGDYDLYVVKTNNAGVIEWQKTIGGSGYDVGTSVIQLEDNDYIISGYTSSEDGDFPSSNGLFDCFVLKLDTAGNIIWQRTYGGSQIDNSFNLIQTNDGGFLMAGTSQSNDGQVAQNIGLQDGWVVKLDALGFVEWEKTYGGTDLEFINSIIQTADNGYVFVGHTYSTDVNIAQNQGLCDAWVVKLNGSGTIEWQKTYGGSELDFLYAIKQTPDGGYITSGQTESSDGNLSNNKGLTDAWILKLDSLGSIEWNKTYGGSNDDSFNSILQKPNGEYLLAGETYSNDFDLTANYGESDCWLVKIGSDGEMAWNTTYGGSNLDGINAIQPTSDGGSIFVGYTFSNDIDVSQNLGIHDMWTVKLSPDSLSNTSIEFDGLCAYPNPVTNFLNVSTLDNFSLDTIRINDMTGKTVLLQTENTNLIDTQNLTSGTYFLQATSNSKTYQTKFIKN